MADQWFDQFNPSQRNGNTGINGGMNGGFLPIPDNQKGPLLGTAPARGGVDPGMGRIIEDPASELYRFQQDYWAPDREQVLAQKQQAANAYNASKATRGGVLGGDVLNTDPSQYRTLASLGQTQSRAQRPQGDPTGQPASPPVTPPPAGTPPAAATGSVPADLLARFQQLGATNTPGTYTPGAAAQPNILGIDPSLQNHQTGAVDPAEWARLIQGLPPITGDGDLKGLNALTDRLKTEGYQVSPGPIDAQGRSDSLVINGQLVRVSDSGGNYIYKPDSASSPAWESGGSGSGGSNADWLAPFTEQAGMPSLADYQASPGYKAGLDAGLHGIESSAFARGDGLTGGTLKKLDKFGQDYATQGYNNFYNQNYNNLAFNRDTFYSNQTNPYTKIYNLAQLGKPAQAAV